MVGNEDLEDQRKRLINRQREHLLDGELLGDALVSAPRQVRPDDAVINQKYERGEIRIVTEQARYPLDSVTTMLSSGNYKLDPDYQRRHRWTVQQRSRLIESFIMNVPVPPVFIYEWDYNKYEVMDGLQRLTAVREFYSGGFALTGLEYWEELEGFRYEQLPSRIRDGVNRRYISSIILLKETSHGDEDPDRLKRFVFGRINTGGVKLSPQELRNALYDGPMNRLCKELSKEPSLRRMWGIPENVEDLVNKFDDPADSTEETLAIELEGADLTDAAVPRAWRDMTDVELVLRFFANRQRLISYRDNIRDYLDAYLQRANQFSPETIEELSGVFRYTLSLAEELFGENAFRRLRGNKWGNVPSVSIYDGLLNALSRLLPQRDKLIAQRESINAGLTEFYASNSQVFNLRGQTRNDVINREVLLEGYLAGFLDQ